MDDRLGLQDRTRVEEAGACTSAAKRTRSARVETPSRAGEPSRVVDVMPSGWRTAWRRYSANGMPDALAMWSPSTSKPALEYRRRLPGGAVTRCSSKARPLVWARRWRTVEPSGPAGSSSSTAPSSYATSAA